MTPLRFAVGNPPDIKRNFFCNCELISPRASIMSFSCNEATPELNFSSRYTIVLVLGDLESAILRSGKSMRQSVSLRFLSGLRVFVARPRRAFRKLHAAKSSVLLYCLSVPILSNETPKCSIWQSCTIWGLPEHPNSRLGSEESSSLSLRSLFGLGPSLLALPVSSCSECRATW